MIVFEMRRRSGRSHRVARARRGELWSCNKRQARTQLGSEVGQPVLAYETRLLGLHGQHLAQTSPCTPQEINVRVRIGSNVLKKTRTGSCSGRLLLPAHLASGALGRARAQSIIRALAS